MKTLSVLSENSQVSQTAISQSALFWAGLILFSAAPRILGSFLLPNAFGDAYSYLQEIEALRAKMADGVFSLKDLHGFWLPMYQFVCAVISLMFGHSFYVSKLVSAICGIGICLIVYQISLILTASRQISLAAFALVASNPLHILYSSTAMTDIPHGFLLMASLYFALLSRWKTAAIVAAAAGFMRVESWALIALLPAFQFVRSRKISWIVCGIVAISPPLWIYICWKATGNPTAYFEARNRYVVEFIAANPDVATFSSSRLALDGERFLTSTNLAVLVGAFAALGLILKRLVGRNFVSACSNLLPQIAVCVVFFYNLGFLLLAYFTNNQPSIWTRYGLLFFVLGMPVLAWAFQEVSRQWPLWKPVLSVALIAVFAWHTIPQVREIRGCLDEENIRQEIADYLKSIHRSNPEARFFCEDGSLRYLSGIPMKSFLDSFTVPADSNDASKFPDYLREAKVEYFICTRWEYSTPIKLFPELGKGKGNDVFQLVMQSSAKYSGLVVWVYQLKTASVRDGDNQPSRTE